MQLVARRPWATLELAAAAVVVVAVSIIQLLSPLRGITFARRNVQPPASVYVSPSDTLHVVNYSSTSAPAVIVRIRMLQPDGQVQVLQFSQSCRSDRGPTVNQYQIGEGFLIGLVAFPSVAQVVRGQVFVQALLARGIGPGTTAMHQLASGYVSGDGWLGWPAVRMEGPSEGPGFIRSITGTDPAAGVEISEAVPSLARWRLQSLILTLVTSATAGSRLVNLVIDDGANIVFRVAATQTQIASLTRTYSAGSPGLLAGPVTLTYQLPLPAPCLLLAGWRVRTVTEAIAAGDNFGPPQLCVEEWLNEAL